MVRCYLARTVPHCAVMLRTLKDILFETLPMFLYAIAATTHIQRVTIYQGLLAISPTRNAANLARIAVDSVELGKFDLLRGHDKTSLVEYLDKLSALTTKDRYFTVLFRAPLPVCQAAVHSHMNHSTNYE